MEINLTEINNRLCAFLDATPNSFFAVHNIKAQLATAGFTELQEGQRWQLVPGGKYYVSRNGSALLAFVLPQNPYLGFQIYACHCDSPAFKLKNNAELVVDNKYVKLNVEKYGGMLMAPWFDRPLSLAGRVAVDCGNAIESRLVNIDRDLLMIPSLAIHMNRKANEGYSYNPQVDLLPLYGGKEAAGSLKKLIAEEADCSPENILASDLYLYNRVAGSIWGAEEEFFSSGRLDDLECVYGSLQGFLKSENKEFASMFCVFDNEETGSGTRQGAASGFLRDVMERIAKLPYKQVDFSALVANSFMLSADNAHSLHPNQPEKSDPTHRPVMNGGVVLKYSANQKYTTDSVSGAVVTKLCKDHHIPLQLFFNRSDMPGGSTLGNISSSQVAIPTADIGLAQLAMHSPYETAGVKDLAYMIRLAEVFYQADLAMEADGYFKVE